MADPRGTEGPFFYKGVFHYRSVLIEQMSDEQRRRMRNSYRQLYKVARLMHPGDSRRARIEARKMMRPILYPEVGMRVVR